MEVGPFAFIVRPRPGIGMDRPYSSRDSLSDRARCAFKQRRPGEIQIVQDLSRANISLPPARSLAVGSRDIKRHPRRCDARGCAAPSLPPSSMRYHAENNKAQAERVRQLQALHESWLAYRTADHGMHGERESGVESLPPSPLLAPSFKRRGKEVGNRRKRARTSRRWDGVKAAANHRGAVDRRQHRHIRSSHCE